MNADVLLVGVGYFGRLLLEDLLAGTQARIILAGRQTDRLDELRLSLAPERLEVAACDLGSAAEIDPLVARVRLAICAAGPYQGLPPTLAERCIHCGIPYIDLSDDRTFVMKVRELASERAGCPTVCSGWSAVPALSAVLTRIAAEGMDRIDAIHIQIAPGNRQPRAKGTVASLLASINRPFTLHGPDGWREARGWSEPRCFEFPEPVGEKTGYLVDVPDHELFPPLFNAGTVEFRAGSELMMLNYAVSAMASLSRRGIVRRWERWATFLRGCMAMFGWLGTASGAMGVEVRGATGGKACGRRVCIVADEKGQRIAVMPAAIMAARILSGAGSVGELVPLDRWLDRDSLERECGSRGFRLTVEDV